eukprot:CAMPEP_0168480880 /NCGR_PEP_ID=MMETSP0228-20121227/64223_1 /TAXON_ID=133427 /ORGANISM="Protoceratium reticulatum, Strain CCCM 535 (=CCMP 1889)" /LENGTH=259 /DNA_ID=CAMNT_0008497229 /DNA_START=21 /DNA_END=797 /DNA_ORIENTATION=-
MACAGRSVVAAARRLAALPRPPLQRAGALAPARRCPHFMPALASRGIVSAEAAGTVMRVDKEHWSAFMFGRERQLLIHVINTAEEGDANGVMAAMDSFWAHTFSMEGTDSWSIRGDLLDKVTQEKAPMRCIEVGTYCGYSALRIARNLPEGGLLVSIEVDPLFAAIATKIVEHAGLAGKVKVLMGTVESKVARLGELLAAGAPGSEAKPVDFVLCDHSKELFVPDLRLLEGQSLVGPGTVVMGDTTVYPGEASADGSRD